MYRIQRFGAARMSILPKVIYRFNIIAGILVEIDKLILNLMQKCKGHRISEAHFKKSKIVRLILPHFKTYSKGTPRQCGTNIRADKKTNECNRIESPEIHSYSLGHWFYHVVFQKGTKAIHWGKEHL